MKNFVVAGDKIQCPGCNAIIATWLVTPIRKEVLQRSMVCFEEGQEPSKHPFEMKCQICSASYMKQPLGMHIADKGWCFPEH